MLRMSRGLVGCVKAYGAHGHTVMRFALELRPALVLCTA